MSYEIYIKGLAFILLLSFVTWVISVARRDVSIVDTIWSLMILSGGAVYATSADPLGGRGALIFALLSLWAARLSIYVTWRNWGEPEDRRYRKIRDKYSPNFALKSLGIIFLFQAVLAWIVSFPLWPALMASNSILLLDGLAVVLCLAGIGIESVADWQLARFKSDAANRGKVMDRGLWRYTRHPNYFGEALVWWGFYAFALSVGAWWTFPAPVLMTWLLLKFSGVVMLEQDISERRPDYRKYIEATNAFIPGPRKRPSEPGVSGQSTGGHTS